MGVGLSYKEGGELKLDSKSGKYIITITMEKQRENCVNEVSCPSLTVGGILVPGGVLPYENDGGTRRTF